MASNALGSFASPQKRVTSSGDSRALSFPCRCNCTLLAAATRRATAAESSAVRATPGGTTRSCASPIRSSTRQRGDLDVDVDAIDQRAGDAVAIADDLFRRAMAAAAGIARRSRRDRDSSRRPIGILRGTRRCASGARRRPRRSPAVRAMPRVRCAEIPGSSSRNSTPRCESDNSPGRNAPPPISAAIDAVCCGLRNGRRPPRLGLRPAADSKLATSRISGSDKGGSNPGNRCASSVLPAPGGPIIRSPCSPAAAISKARLAAYWPRTSARSGIALCRASRLFRSGSCAPSSACDSRLPSSTWRGLALVQELAPCETRRRRGFSSESRDHFA